MSHMYPRLEHPGGDKPLMQYWDEKRAKERCKLARNHHFGEGKVKVYQRSVTFRKPSTY